MTRRVWTLTHEQAALVVANLDVANRVVDAMRLPARYVDDATQNAAVGLMVAARDWDGTGTFAGYARMKIRYAVIDGVRDETRSRRVGWTGNGCEQIDSYDRPSTDRGTEDTAVGHLDACAQLAQLDRLPIRDVALVGRIAAGCTHAEAALALGVSESRIDQLLRRIRTTIKGNR